MYTGGTPPNGWKPQVGGPQVIPQSTPQSTPQVTSQASLYSSGGGRGQTTTPQLSTSSGPTKTTSNPGNKTPGTDIIRLHQTPREREMYDNMADLFSIIKTTEALEKAYVRDAITAEEYKNNCMKLINQFKAACNLTKDYVPDVKRFMQEYRLDCKAAEKRLIEEGIPLQGPKVDDTARTVAETVQFFITLMDSLKLNLTAVDQIHPLLADLLDSICKISNLPPDWEGKIKIRTWLVSLNTMKAADQLNEQQIRQMLFDLESSYNAFHKSLGAK